MALSCRLVYRKNMKQGEGLPEKVYYAQARSTGKCDIRRLCTAISERCTVTSSDIKAVLDALVVSMKSELSDGKIVRLRNFGSFRITFGSEGAESEEKFNANLIRRPKYTFAPDINLQEQAKILKYRKYSPEVIDNTEECPLPHIE